MSKETKEERFKRVAEKRVQNVLDSLKKLSQCSNKRVYSSDKKQLEKIWNAIEEELNQCKSAFDGAEREMFRL